MLLASGRWRGEQILSKGAVDQMFSDQVPPRVVVRAPTLRVDDVRYGLGTWIEMDGEKVLRFSAPGSLGFTPWIDRETETGCVFAVQDRGPRVQRLLPFLREAVHEAVTSPAVTGTSETVRLRHDGRNRRYHLHVPPHEQNVAGLPLLLVLHDRGADGEHAREVTGLDRIGVEKGFVVAFLDGTGRLPKRQAGWNAGGDGSASRSSVDDVAFCKAVVADIQKRVPIDAQRVFVTGHGNGGAMCHRLAREAADVFRGIAPVAGAMNATDHDPSSPVAVLMVHGTNDQHVRIAGGPSGRARGAEPRVDAALQAAVDYYVERNGLVAYPQASAEGAVRIARYVRAKGDAVAPPVWVVRLEGGGHAWPGARKRSPLVADRPFDWPASRAIVEFFAGVGAVDGPAPTPPAVPR